MSKFDFETNEKKKNYNNNNSRCYRLHINFILHTLHTYAIRMHFVSAKFRVAVAIISLSFFLNGTESEKSKHGKQATIVCYFNDLCHTIDGHTDGWTENFRGQFKKCISVSAGIETKNASTWDRKKHREPNSKPFGRHHYTQTNFFLHLPTVTMWFRFIRCRKIVITSGSLSKNMLRLAKIYRILYELTSNYKIIATFPLVNALMRYHFDKPC